MIKYIFIIILMKEFNRIKKILLLINFFYLLKFFDYNYINLSNIIINDEISYYLIILTRWVFRLVLLITNNKIYMIYYINLLKYLIILIIIVFSFIDLLYFYIIFEIRLIVIFILIIGFGSQYERLRSRLYIIFYTIFPSLIILLSINYYNNLSFDLIIIIIIKNIRRIYFFWAIILILFIKLPIFIFHYWLPKAHVDASLDGSIILARIFLKLGAYGIYRLIKIIEKIIYFYKNYFMIYFLLSRLLLSIFCCLQIDIKIVIAYSSIVHIRFIIRAFIRLIKFRFIGFIIIIISHGLCSSGIFILVNIIYQQIYRRRILIIKGLINIIPIFTIFFFFIILSNFSCPPSLRFFREIFIIILILKLSMKYLLIIIRYIFFNSIYSLIIFINRQFNKIFMLINIDLINKEFLSLLIFRLPINLIYLIKLF